MRLSLWLPYINWFELFRRNVIYYRGIWHALSTICKDEGFLALYKGLGATLWGVGLSIAISFSVYETSRSYWQSQRPNDSSVLVGLACGSVSVTFPPGPCEEKNAIGRCCGSTTCI